MTVGRIEVSKTIRHISKSGKQNAVSLFFSASSFFSFCYPPQNLSNKFMLIFKISYPDTFEGTIFLIPFQGSWVPTIFVFHRWNMWSFPGGYLFLVQDGIDDLSLGRSGVAAMAAWLSSQYSASSYSGKCDWDQFRAIYNTEIYKQLTFI